MTKWQMIDRNGGPTSRFPRATRDEANEQLRQAKEDRQIFEDIGRIVWDGSSLAEWQEVLAEDVRERKAKEIRIAQAEARAAADRERRKKRAAEKARPVWDG